MDTKSRKSTKLAKLIIALCVILPAVFLVSLYPTMEEAMLEKKAYYEELQKQDEELNNSWVIADNLVNYAMEASYYSYAELWNSTETDKLDLNVFNEFGWNNDYAFVKDNTSFRVTYKPSEDIDPIVKDNVDKFDSSICKLEIQFDSHGNIAKLDMTENQEMYKTDLFKSDFELYQLAMESVNQFKNNLSYYNDSTGNVISEEKYMPKNFIVELGINEYSNFAATYEEWYGGSYYNTAPEQIYWETGSYGIIPLIYIFILFIAMTLPFIKSLNTGKEKVFSMPLEVMVAIVLIVIGATVGMGFAMAYTTMETAIDFAGSSGGLMFVGTTVGARTIYALMISANIAGWSIVFFLVYIISANLRQLISDTKAYLKYQTLSVRFLRWVKSKVVRLYRSIMDIDLDNNTDKGILKIVLLNLVILLFLGCLKFFGMVGLVIYSIILFVIIRREMKNVQRQYKSVLHMTEQMAEGNLKIKLEEDLGVFEPIGSSLEKVQQGFEKAVVEEAKSQNMKTELITNVSHDLKTPLTAIITYVDLLKKEDVTDEERKQYIETLDQKSQRLKVLIEDLFEVSKAQSGNVKMNYMDVDVVSLLKQVKSEMSDQIQASSLDFKWNISAEKVMLSLDGQRTYRVFENLISNALKYSLPNSRVYVNLSQDEECVKIVFRNVSAQELDFDPDRLTDRFVRGDASRNSEGSGLGLAIAKSFVELQKGTFKIEVDDDLFKVIITWKK